MELHTFAVFSVVILRTGTVVSEEAINTCPSILTSKRRKGRNDHQLHPYNTA